MALGLRHTSQPPLPPPKRGGDCSEEADLKDALLTLFFPLLLGGGCVCVCRGWGNWLWSSHKCSWLVYMENKTKTFDPVLKTTTILTLTLTQGFLPGKEGHPGLSRIQIP